jgi:hypothetical protein
VISERKFLILQHCNIVPSSPKTTSETIGHTGTANAMLRMVERGLMTVENGSYSTTAEGRIEMRLYRDAATRVVPAPKINKFDGVYVLESSYQRNGGLKEIRSVGVSC